MNKRQQPQINANADWELIKALGGPTFVAKLLGVKNAQVVMNWKKRGIPYRIRQENATMFDSMKKRLLESMEGK